MVASRALTTALGLLSIAIADFRARRGLEPSEPFFWLGLLIIFVPIALPLLSPNPSRRERIGLVTLLGFGLQFVKVLYSPGNPAFFDEFSHTRTATDIALSGHLFLANPLQPISPYYPGLESFTVAFAQLSGLSLNLAAVVVILVARMVLVLALFMLFERASRSHRVAGAAVLIYTANPSFVLFDGQFSYESIALGLSVVTAALLAARTRWHSGEARARALLAGVAIAATVVTHHVTSYALVALLAGWAFVGRLHRRADPRPITPLAAAVFAAAAAGAWLALVSPLTVGYIEPNVTGGVQQLVGMITGETTGRRLFEDAAGVPAPLLERAVGYLATILLLAALPFALWTVWRFYRRSPIAITFGLVALGYPASLALRLTGAGAETAGRLSAFVFIGLAFSIAVWAARVTAGKANAIRRRLLAVAATATFVGGVVVGFAPWARLPFPYRPAADSRSFEPEAISVANWTLAALGPHHAFLTDRANRQLIGSLGRQDPIYNIPAADVLLSSAFDQSGLAVISRQRIEYVLTDRRLSLAVPLSSGAYVIGRERGGAPVKSPLDPAAFTKFDLLPEASRIFDAGDIQIFDMKALW